MYSLTISTDTSGVGVVLHYKQQSFAEEAAIALRTAIDNAESPFEFHVIRDDYGHAAYLQLTAIVKIGLADVDAELKLNEEIMVKRQLSQAAANTRVAKALNLAGGVPSTMPMRQ